MSVDWTPERTATLMALWGEDLSTAEIGRRLGITKNAVIGKAHRLGLPYRRPPAPPKEKPANVLTMETLKPGMCSWPIGEPGDEGFRFCGEPVAVGKPYCAAHCAVAYVGGKDKKVAVA